MTDRRSRRREYLSAIAGLAAVWVAGCTDETVVTDDPAGAGEPTATGERSPTAVGTTVETTSTETGTETGLDLREANVVGVKTEKTADGYRFDVTLYHDDHGEDGYANWWQVETLDGDRLGRRELLHAHSTDPFTRSETVEIPDDVTCVVIRGHDQTHEYGGQAMTVDVETGETAAVRQRAERESVSASTCP